MKGMVKTTKEIIHHLEGKIVFQDGEHDWLNEI